MTWDIDNFNESVKEGFMSLFDWDIYVFQHIPKNKETEDSQRMLRKIEFNKKWQAKVQKKSIACFYIIKRWVEMN
jgi:hypothetical protein